MPIRLLLLALALSVTCPAAWAQEPVGPEFRVNSYTTGRQGGPAVACDTNGNFVVVWESRGQDGSDVGVFGQRFNASGVPLGNEFQVNSYTSSAQNRPAVASDANGDFVVVWGSNGQDGSGYGVFGRRFDAFGLPQGSEFQVNSYTTGRQTYPAVASDANGTFVVVWTGYDGDIDGVRGQRFNAHGIPQGSEFGVNSYTTGDQWIPAVASDANGNLVVVWTSFGQDGSGWGIFAQRFGASGVPQGSEFPINSYTTGDQWLPAVAADANGNFVVVWTSYDANSDGVVGRRFDAAGLPQGSEFQVNSSVTARQWAPAVAAGANGDFVVAWHNSWPQDGFGFGVFGQRFNASAVPQGAEFQVNSYTTGDQWLPAVAADAKGNFVVAWTSYLQDGSYPGVYGQRYSDLILKDGFE